MQSFSNFPGFWRPMSEELCREKPSIMVFCESPLIRVSFVAKDQWASPKRRMEDFSRHNSSLIGRKTQAKFENDCIARCGHSFKITQPNLMILVSFSSAEDALSNNVNKYNTFSSQGTENPPFRFFWDTRYMQVILYMNSCQEVSYSICGCSQYSLQMITKQIYMMN